jgi:hypothetical protein
MPKTTLRALECRLDELERQVVLLREQLRGSTMPPPGTVGQPPDLDATLDQFLDAAGIPGELSGLARLRALQANQERRWADGRRSAAAPAGSSARRTKGPARGN